MLKKNYFSKNSTNIKKKKNPEGNPVKNKSLNKSCNFLKETLVLLKVRYTYNCHTLCMEFVECKLDWKYFRNSVSSRGKLYFTEIQDTSLVLNNNPRGL